MACGDAQVWILHRQPVPWDHFYLCVKKLVDHRSDICWLAWRLRRLPPCKVDHLAPLGHVEVMEWCVEGALEAQTGQLNLGKWEVIVMSFVSLMWNRMVMVTFSHHYNALQIRDTAAIKAQHSFEVVMICLQKPISHNLSWLKLNISILVKTWWIWETEKVFERHFTSAERRRMTLSPSISSAPLLISIDLA